MCWSAATSCWANAWWQPMPKSTICNILIEERAVLTIARRQPMAIDLREIVGAMRVATDLERIGDLAKNMGKRVAALESDFQP